MKKINERKKTIQLLVKILNDMDNDSLIDLWNNRCALGKDLDQADKELIVYKFSDFDAVCSDMGLSFMDVAFMTAHSENQIGAEYFVADNGYNDVFYFFNGDEAKLHIPTEELAEYMTDYVDGCGDKIIQAFLDAIATVEEA